LRAALRLSAAQIRATSVEETQLGAGSDIDESLRAEVRDSQVFIAVLSPNSLASTYVLFELGARWGADRKMLPLLMPNMSPEQLDSPLNRLYAPKADRPGLLSLIEQAAKTLGIDPESAASIEGELAEVLQQRSDYLDPLAYAVLSYVLDKRGRFALLKDPHYEKIQPPGRRLKWGEQPHEVALEMVNAELDLPIEELRRFPSHQETRYGKTRIVPFPFQVQLERNPHRKALLHYDFVYVFLLDRDGPEDLDVRQSPDDKSDPRWFTYEEVEAAQKSGQWPPHEDMLPTMHRILDSVRIPSQG
jgi:hypothetical protein